MRSTDVIEILRENVKPAAGCTEVVAIALASSIAYNAIYGNFPKTTRLGVREVPLPKKEKLRGIEVVIDRNVFKNAYGVAIPGTDKRGIELAALLGLFLDMNRFFKSEEEPGYLEIFRQLDKAWIPVAESMVERVSVDIDSTKDDLYIHVKVRYDAHEAESVLQSKHDGISRIMVDGEVVYRSYEERKKDVGRKRAEKEAVLKLRQILKAAEEIGEEEKRELQKTIDVNRLLVEEGLLGNYGMGIVRAYKNLIKKGMLPDDLLTKIKLQVAAGVEARMGGTEYPAMSSSGSGNNGITAAVPIIAAGEYLNVDKDRILKGILISHLVVKEISDYVGELSALCGACNKSAFGAAAGLVYIMGGGRNEIENAINYVASSIVGMVCDGAKYGCVLKAIAAASTAYEAAIFALEGIQPPPDGVVEGKADDTLRNLGEISRAMVAVDDVVVHLIHRRGERLRKGMRGR